MKQLKDAYYLACLAHNNLDHHIWSRAVPNRDMTVIADTLDKLSQMQQLLYIAIEQGQPAQQIAQERRQGQASQVEDADQPAAP